jgi:hypothetical protein
MDRRKLSQGIGLTVLGGGGVLYVSISTMAGVATFWHPWAGAFVGSIMLTAAGVVRWAGALAAPCSDCAYHLRQKEALEQKLKLASETVLALDEKDPK